MKRHLFASSAVLALVMGLVNVSTSWGKPADLPAQDGIECPDGSDDPVQGKFSIELDINSKGITLKVGSGVAKTEPPMAIDALLPVYVEQWLLHVGDVLMRPDRFISVEAILSKLPSVWILGTGQRNEASNDTNRERKITPAARAMNLSAVETRMFVPVNLHLKEMPVKQAIKDLAYLSGVPLVLDYRALKDAKIDLNTAVSIEVENTSLHTALQQILQPLQLTFAIENDVVMITTKERLRNPLNNNERSAKEAQRLFETGERCRRSGEYDKARTCFQQVHLLAPTTLHGRMAIVRLEEIEERMRDVSEEQGAPAPGEDPDQVFRDMRDRSVPLGLVEVSY
jgi:hypothetical protein